MERIVVAPRTAEWMEVRNESWTASTAGMLCVADNVKLLRAEAAKIGVTLEIDRILAVGMTSFYGNTPWKCWAEKVGQIPSFKGNADTERGVRNEERIVAHFEAEKLLLAEREVTARHATERWLLASFDALVPASSDPLAHLPHGAPLEAKCPAFHSRKKMFEAKKACGSYIRGLPYYWAQVQHQIYVADSDYGWFVAAGIEEDTKTKTVKLVFPIIEKVMRDDAFLNQYVAVARFYHEHYLATFTPPPQLDSDRLLQKQLADEAAVTRALRDQDAVEAVRLYQVTLQELASMEARKAKIEEALLALASSRRTEGDIVVEVDEAYKVEYTQKQGAVSWQKVAQAMATKAGVTLDAAATDPFRGKGKEDAKLVML